MLTFYLVRHGSTEHNRKSIYMGHIDSPLTDEGIKNAQTLARRFKRMKDVEFDYVYSSDLGRAFITAHIIVESLEIEKKLNRARELREVNIGIFSNKPKEEVDKKYPEFKKDASFIPPEGESFYDAQKKAVNFIKLLERRHPNKTLLIVTHAGIIRSLKSHFNEWDYQDHLNMKMTHEYVGKFVIDKGNLLSYEKINE